MLKDDYETLLRRGMPKHPDIFNAGSYLAHNACEYDGRNGCLSDSDTRDLLTMHALRWAWDTPKPPSRVCTRASECRNVPWIPTLEYIIEVTAHLEPRCSQN